MQVGQDDLVHMLLTALFGLIAWAMKQLKNHVDACNDRAVESAEMMQWVGDSIHTMADKAGVRLSPRPKRRDHKQ